MPKNLVLLVEDEVITSKLCKNRLDNPRSIQGVELATTLDEALEAMKYNKFDTIILDEGLADGSLGSKLLLKAVKIGVMKNKPFIICNSYDEYQRRNQARVCDKLGFRYYNSEGQGKATMGIANNAELQMYFNAAGDLSRNIAICALEKISIKPPQVKEPTSPSRLNRVATSSNFQLLFR